MGDGFWVLVTCGGAGVIARDPVVNGFVDSLVQASGLDPRRGAEVSV